MKVWFKILVGTLLGLILGVFLPLPAHGDSSVLFQFNDFIVSLGRYALFPFVFFSAAVAVGDLNRSGRLRSVLVRSLIYMFLASLLLVLIGALFILLFSPERIPITSRRETELIFRSWNDTLANLVPKNLFQILTGGADFLLPLYALSFLLGLHFHFDRTVTEPTVNLFDSLSRIFYHLNSFVVEVLGWGMIVLGAAWLVQIRLIQDISLYFQIFAVLLVATLFVLLVVLPLLLFLLVDRKNPFPWIFGLMGAGIGAFFSGDSFFSLSLATRMTRENLGVPRKVGAVNLPLFSMFGRAGTALTSTIAFFIILKSYSSLEISLDQILWTISFAFLLSFALPSVPGLGAYINLSLLCSFYGKGLENGYLNLQPILPVLVSFSALLDVYLASFCSFLVTRHENLQKEIPPNQFI
ncbi:MAG: cation:dicarboxylase symporter family transporter [Spirochaetales bacterium]